jgi:hypothetical protein
MDPSSLHRNDNEVPMILSSTMSTATSTTPSDVHQPKRRQQLLDDGCTGAGTGTATGTSSTELVTAIDLDEQLYQNDDIYRRAWDAYVQPLLNKHQSCRHDNDDHDDDHDENDCSDTSSSAITHEDLLSSWKNVQQIFQSTPPTPQVMVRQPNCFIGFYLRCHFQLMILSLAHSLSLSLSLSLLIDSFFLCFFVLDA